MIKPYMSLLSDLFCSRVRSEILRLLFGEPAGEFYLREIVRRSGLTLGTVQQDLAKLRKLDLVTSRRDGNRLFYKANSNHPLYLDLQGIVAKTVGIVPKLQERLAPLKASGEIEIAFIFGSIAQGKEKALSDVDLMVIGKLGLRGITRALSGLGGEVGREVNPHTLTPEEFKRRVERKDHFLTRVLGEPKTFLVGDEDELKQMAG
jgi:DNA-binding transcriptional ArsR family regulator